MKLRPIFAFGLAMVCLTASAGRADEIEGVGFADRYQVGDELLRLHGVGLLRYRLLLKGYVAALYLGEEVAPDAVLEDVPRRLEIEYFWSIEADDFAEATIEGIDRNVDAATFDRLRDRIEQINALYEDVKPGDRYALTYLPGAGTELSLNGEPKGSIAGSDFSSALFAIWIGEQPLDRRLRDQLLEKR